MYFLYINIIQYIYTDKYFFHKRMSSGGLVPPSLAVRGSRGFCLQKPADYAVHQVVCIAPSGVIS